MQTTSGFEPLLDAILEIDEEGLRERLRGGEVIIDDRDLSLLRHQNRIAVALGPVTLVGRDEQHLRYYDLTLLCVLHPGPGCHFRSARLVVDLRATPGALVRDMAPRDLRGEHPVELTTTVRIGLEYEIIPSVVSGEASREKSTTRKLYYPQILASGKGFARALWDFRSLPGEHLQSDRELRMLVSAPAEGPLLARFNMVAQVSLEGTGRIVPLLRKRTEINEVYPLA